jgi:hypothetical protein
MNYWQPCVAKFVLNFAQCGQGIMLGIVCSVAFTGDFTVRVNNIIFEIETE